MADFSRKLGTEHMSRLLVRMSAPAMVGLLVQALYNLTDTVFVGRGVGPLAIAGIAICFPVQTLVMAVAQTFGIGCSSIVSRALGADDRALAQRTLGNLFALILLSSAAIAVLGSLYIDPLLRLFGATEGILPYARDYLEIILIGSPFFLFAMATNAVVRAEGNARVAMWTMIISGALNIVLDPLFIYGFGMGIGGAALATVLAQATTVLYLIYYFAAGGSGLRARLGDFVLRLRIVGEAFAIGAGSFARMIAGSITIVILNHTLAAYGGDIAISAFGVVNRLLNFFLLPLFGVIQGMMPIVGYNYGSGAISRVRSALRMSIWVTSAMSVAATALLAGFPGPLLRVFTDDPDLLRIGIAATRVIVIALPTVGFQVVAGGMYQALGRALPAFVLALLRQVIVLTPLILLLPRLIGLRGVWTSFPIADGTAAAVTAVMLFLSLRTLRRREEAAAFVEA
jgi:putative MATE family efflux protein